MSESTELAAEGVAPPESAPDESPPGESPKRRPGARPGNRNAFKHGCYGAAAQATRAAARADILARIPDADFHSSQWKAGEGGGGSILPAFKRNNYVARKGAPKPAAPEPVSPDPTQSDPTRRRGAPSGNCNALKHGRRSGEMRAFWSEFHGFLRAARAVAAAVDAEVARRATAARGATSTPR